LYCVQLLINTLFIDTPKYLLIYSIFIYEFIYFFLILCLCIVPLYLQNTVFIVYTFFIVAFLNVYHKMILLCVYLIFVLSHCIYKFSIYSYTYPFLIYSTSYYTFIHFVFLSAFVLYLPIYETLFIDVHIIF